MNALQGNWNYPTAVRFGAGRISELAEACRALGMSRPLLVTDRGLAGLPIVQEAITANQGADLPTGLFSDVQGNPVGQNVDDGVAVFRNDGHDGVIAMGGGSALDVGKAIALMAGQTRPLWDFEGGADWWTRVDPDGMAPVVAVPTTSGTGSEVGRASVIIDASRHTKKIIFHPGMLPATVIADPALTVGLPPHLTAWTGIDALSHNLEAWCSPLFHPMADGIALEGMQLIRRALPRAVTDGADLTARSEMMIASTMGATAFQKGLGGMHAIAHPIGATLNTHHGRTNGVLMPYVLMFNRSVIEDRLTDAARYLNLTPSFDGFLSWVLELREQIGIPHALSDLGVGEEHIEILARLAVVEPCGATNPKTLSIPNLERLIAAAVAGDLEAAAG